MINDCPFTPNTREAGDKLIAWAAIQRAKRKSRPILVEPYRVSKCRWCGGEIVWMKTAKGKDIPVEANSVTPFDKVFDKQKNEAHFPTCREQRHADDAKCVPCPPKQGAV